MTLWPSPLPPLRTEVDFGGRSMRCFPERPVGIDAMLRRAAAEPDLDALVCDNRRLSWREIDAQATQAAVALAARGVRAGDHVAMLLGNSIDFAIALFAVARLGAISGPMSTRLMPPEVLFVVGDCGASALAFEEPLQDRVPKDMTLANIAVTVDRPCYGRDGAQAVQSRPAVNEELVANILHTSGTTGRPKGAMLTHLNIAHSVMHYQVCMRLDAEDRSRAAVPLSHVTGLVGQLLTMAHCGGALVLLPVFKAADFLALESREHITHTVMVPAMYKLCMLEDFEAHDLSAWRIGAYGGAPMPPATIVALQERWLGLALMNAHGATETTSPATIMSAQHTAGQGDSVGRAVPCADVSIRDAQGQPVAAGEAGEVWIAGPMVVPGYWNNPDETASNISAGWWRSGDIGSLDAEDYLRVHDRLKDVVDRGGYKVHSAEVEAVLASPEGVLEAAVVGVPCEVLGEDVHAFASRRSRPLEAAALLAFCRERIAAHKVPETWTLVDEPVPRNANGKSLKRLLRERLHVDALA